MTLLKELINIPESVQKGDFVLRLSEGVTRPADTLRDYVVTPELKDHFDDALRFIKSAMDTRSSKATYLHGSFGSGKSHFMAVLHLLLQDVSEARAIPELASVIQTHNAWCQGKKFLLVPYHMIGAKDVESGILGGYVDFVRRHHPDAPIPGVYLAEGLFRDAENLREHMGDASFFGRLNEGTEDQTGWGDLASAWDAQRFHKAIHADPGTEERSLLIGALISKFFGSYDNQNASHGEAFLSLDKGLSVISKHAQSLGYDALILFLDELILWLASHAADVRFVHHEGQKLAKLVEAQAADRPIPIISFIARQRDLSELIGDTVPGADRVSFSDALRHWEGRFHRITLEDRNLPAIAERRVLRCKDSAARSELDAAFQSTAKIRESVMNTLLTRDGDVAMFRKVYPFSPALVQTLIAVSSVLQRERTALKVMMQLLVNQRETLRVGDIVPVGDLFDVIAHGDEAFSREMEVHFNNAHRLYQQKLLPLLEKQYGHREDLAQLPWEDTKRTAFRNDDRLIKTLLLSALVPEVESLRGLNSERLAALNHGTIKTPIAGREGQIVLSKCREWAANVGEIRIGGEANPTISVQISGVDTESILRQAENEDNQGNRIRKIREMLFEQMGVAGEGEFEQVYEFLWKNTKRSCTILFRNIRELPPSSFQNEEQDWKLIIDFPFDEPGHGPRDDISKLQQFRQQHVDGAKTLCWVPQFFNEDAKRDLGKLVILDHIMTGERFSQFSNHLSQQDRAQAKTVLENQRSSLRQRVRLHLDCAYGVEPSTNSIDTTHELDAHEQFISLWPGCEIQPPVAADLSGAMQHLLHQALRHEFPGAPDFEAEVKRANLTKVHSILQEAMQTPDGRIEVERTVRPLMRQIANPLQLGEMGHDATHFLLGHYWRTHFIRKAVETGLPMTVKNLRAWINQPKPMGLPKEAENLVILSFAQQTDRVCLRHGGAWDVSIGQVPDDCEFREQQLPDAAEWELAVQRAASIFGHTSSRLLKAANVNALSAAVRKRVAETRGTCVDYAQALRQRWSDWGKDRGESDRMKTVVATLQLLQRIQESSDPDKVVRELAQSSIATSESAMGECIARSVQLSATLTSTAWDMFAAITRLGRERNDEVQQVLNAVVNALAHDEHVVNLATTLKGAQAAALRLLTVTTAPVSESPATSAAVTTSPRQPPSQTLPQPSSSNSGQLNDVDAKAVREALDAIQARLEPGQRLRVSMTWRIE